MHIAFLVHDFPALSETFVINQAIGLMQRGHDVDIYTNRIHHLEKVHPDVVNYRLLERTYTLPTVPDALLPRVILALGLLVRHMHRNPSIFWRSLNFFRYGLAALSLRSIYVAVLLADKPTYDVVHCQFGTHWFRGMTFCQLMQPRPKLVIMFRGYDISTYVQSRGDRVYERAFREADCLLANCEFFRQRAISLGCPADKILVHRSGLDCGKFPLSQREQASTRIQVATTGRLVTKKGIEYAIRAIAQLLPTYPHLHYHIIGDGELRPQLQQLIDDLGVGHAVRLLGWKTEQEIAAILNETDVFVAPSVTADDGNQDAPTNVLKEAMATGIPVISTLHGGIPELVDDQVNGFLVPERDVQALADRLEQLIQQPERRRQMGLAGRATVETHYNLQALNDRLVEIYQDLNAIHSPVIETRRLTTQPSTL